MTWLKQGRTAATARATLVQGGVPIIEAVVTTGMLGPARRRRSDGDGRGRRAFVDR